MLIMMLDCVSGPSAAASCATDHPGPSPYAFVGTVIETKQDGYVATVITDAGDRVTVLGAADTGWFAARSSVDRQYVLGARYEFHPTNSADPYQDNICTATRKLAGPDLPPAGEPSGSVNPVVWGAIGGVGASALLIVGSVIMLRRRRRRAVP